MTDPLASIRAQAAELAARRADVVAAAAKLAAGADTQARAAVTAAALADHAAFDETSTAATGLRAQRRDALGGVSGIDAERATLLAAAAGDPCDLEADVPLVLLPVRLETRYSADGRTLRVRIYPDDVHIDRLDRGVSDDERAAGIAYWTAIWAGTATDPGAWQTLVDTVHPARAAWVAAATSPDLSTRPNPPVGAPGPVVADPPTRQQQPPVARTLPDRFVVVAVQGSTINRAVGKPVPPELVVGLPPGSDPDDLVRTAPTGTDSITLGPGMQWLVDPAEAEAVGMLVEVPLAQPGAAVDHVLAFGVRASLSPAGGATELSDLLVAHRYATGAAFVAPGTPTNNTETDRAAWTTRTDPGPPPTTLVDPPAGADATVLAQALGVDPSSLSGWDGADRSNQPLARAANTTLWQASWGTFIERLLSGSTGTPTVPDPTREAWRDWWQGFVRGGGPLPLLRLGDQPYGVLPVSSVQGAWQAGDGDAFEQVLLDLLRAARPLVAAAVPGLPHVGSAEPLDQSLLEVLGSAPEQLGLRVRSIGSPELGQALQVFFGADLGGTNTAEQDELAEALFLQLGIDAAGLRGSIGQRTRPLGLPLVLDDPVTGDQPYLGALLANTPRSVNSVLQALLEICAAREQAAVDAAAPAELVGQVFDVGARLIGDRTQQYVQLVAATRAGRVSPAELHKGADELEAQFGTSGPSALSVLQPVLATRSSLAEFAVASGLPAAVAEQQAVTALSAWFRASARRAEFEAAAELLVSSPVRDRGHAVAATLDCASHRYDAWVSSLPTRRLATLRGDAPTGVLVGAYGWVEGLAPGVETTRPGGYVHAPSLAHAATAGVMRSGYLTHNPDGSGSGALAVDLSSARVRAALGVLDGVRQGQPLGALLGYLIERRLHEQGLDVYTLSLRALAPISAGRLVDHADALPDQAQEAIGANNVVDGVALLALPASTLWAELAAAPVDNPYLDSALWPVPTAADQTAIAAILDEARGAYDGISDVLLAESVHSLVQGNTARAGAAMAAAAGGDAAPLEPEVVRTPTRAVVVTHRVLVLLDDTAPGSGGWSAGTPRAIAEPRLAAWAERRLGAASSVVIDVAADGSRTTLDSAGLSALDVVFDSAHARILAAGPALVLDAPTLGARLRAAVPALGVGGAGVAGGLPVIADPSWPTGLRAIGELAIQAASLASLLAAATPVTPASFARPNDDPADPPGRTVDDSALAARLAPVVGALSDATSALAAALAADPVDPAAVGAAVAGLRAFGIALPDSVDASAVAPAVLAEAASRLAAAQAVSPFDPTAVAGAVFGPGFVVLAPVTGATDLFTAVLDGVTPGRAAVRRWLRDVATVRPGVARFAETLLLDDAVGTSPTLRVAQLAASGTTGTATWLGLPVPAGDASPDQPVTDVVVDAPAGYTGAQPIAGLVVDEWIEQLPRRNADGSATITTGVAVNANAPGARAPQAILLAVPPDGSRWSSDALITLLTETRALAGLRAVTLERYQLASPLLPAIQEQSWSLQGEPTLDLAALVNRISSAALVLPYVKETGGVMSGLDIEGIRSVAVPAALQAAFLFRPPGWTRLEPQSVSGDPTPGLEARLADPLWLLARQWQFGEFAAEDAGSPVAVHVASSTAAVSGWAPAGGATRPLPPGDLLEPSIEREPVPARGPGLRDRAEAGAELLAVLTEAGADVARLLTACPLTLPWVDPADRAAAGLLACLGGRVPDAELAAVSMAGGLAASPPDAPAWLPGATDAQLAALGDWYDWYRDQVAPLPAPADDCWVDDRLEYQFRLDVGDQTFTAPSFGGGRVDWHDVDAGSAVPPAGVAARAQTMLATPLRFAGMPADRYWQFEDSQVNLGALQVQPHDLARLLLVEFATVYGNDWLVVPVDVPLGSFTTIDSVSYTTTFGEQPVVTRADDSGGAGRFRLFEVSVAGTSDTLPGLFVPPSVTGVLDGPALEEVLYLRDETANLAWAVERTVQGPSGDPRSRRDEGYPAPFEPGVDPAAELDYLLQSAVPEWWIPFLPYSTGYSTIALAKGVMSRADASLVEPLGVLLRPGESLAVRDEEIPREGARVRRVPTLARRVDGSLARWITRRVTVGRGEGSSGLAFDSTIARRPSPPPA